MFDFDAVHTEVRADGVRAVAEHEAGRERPRLTPEVLERVHPQVHFLEDLAMHCVLRGLTRFHVSRDDRIPLRRPDRLSRKQQPIGIIDDGDNHRGIGAWIVRARIDDAMPFPSRERIHGFGAAA